ncbi:MAG: hypothetical protein AAB348_03870 [Patescibacteria group bacterium]
MLDIEKIIQDIYALEPSLKEREAELLKIIKEIAALKPDTKFDQNFYNQLKIKLMENITPKEDVRGFWQNLFSKKLIFVPVALAVLAIVVVPSLMNKNRAGGGQVVALADRAFGSLVVSSGGTNEKSSGIVSQEAVAPTRSMGLGGNAELMMGGGGGTTMVTMGMSAPVSTQLKTTAVSSDSVVGSGVAISSKMMAPYYYQPYTFEYKGEPLVLAEDKMDVLRRIKNTAVVSGELNSILANAGFNAMDWGKLSGMKLQNISMTEDKKGGFSIYIGVEEGSISINKNYDYVRCMSLDCGPRPLKESDMPSDETIIGLADKFLSEYGINKDDYGKPEVQNDWRVYLGMASAEMKPDFYYPETISVIYSQMLNGKEVYDESGNKTGLVVNVDIREMKGAGLWNLFSQKHEASAYEVEKDTTRLVKLAEQGGFRRGYYYAEGTVDSSEDGQVEVKKNVIELGTPTIGFVKMWIYNENNGQEMIVPAYIFPIVKKPDDIYFYQKNVVVPLIKEILDQDQNQPMPMPMMKGGIEPMMGASGGATMMAQ